jgi:anti-sigma factor RsiW
MRARASHACQEFLERLSLYVDGDLPAAARRQVERQLDRCPCCRDLVDSLEETVAICRQAARRRLPSDVKARARARIAALLERESQRRPARARCR